MKKTSAEKMVKVKMSAFACSIILFTLTASAAATANVTLTYSVKEESPLGTIVGHLGSHRTVQLLLAQLNGTQKPSTFFNLPKPSHFFTIDESNGLIRTKSRIDREILCEMEVPTCCHLGHKHMMPGRPECYIPLHIFVSPLKEFLQVIVAVNDINDNVPTFSQPEIITFVSENETPGQFCIDLPPAVDADSNRFAVQDYRLQEPSSTFRLQVNNRPVTKYDDMCLLVEQHLDREKVSSYIVKVLAIDGGLPAHTGTLSLTIRVLDSNDNRPQFRNDSYTISIAEDFAVNAEIIQLDATDADEGDHGKVMYSFVSPTDGQLSDAAHPAVVDRFGPFFINADTGSITLDSPLDFEETRFYELRVLARDFGTQAPRFSTTSVMIHVTDVNDCPPEIELYPASLNGAPREYLEVFENEPAGTLIGMIVVTDRDEHLERRPNCWLTSPHFEMRPLDERIDRFGITTRTSFDREALERYHVTLRCEDAGTPVQATDVTITINIIDRNDNAPSFASEATTIRVRENNRVGARLGRLNFSDADANDDVTDIEFLVSSIDPNVSTNVITIRNASGEIFANIVFDRERREAYRFKVAVRDPKSPHMNVSSILLTILIEDENDMAPRFNKSAYTFKVSENLQPQTLIGSVKAHDEDALHNAALHYTLDNPHPAFSMTERGDLFALGSLDRETATEYKLVVVATDRGMPRLSSTVEIFIEVLDKNDNKPVFTWPTARNNTITISSAVMPGTIGTVKAIDDDANENSWIAYSLVGEESDLLEVDERSGNVILKRTLLESDRRIMRIMVKATDSGTPSLHETATVNIQFVDNTLNGRSTEKTMVKDEWNDMAVLVMIGFSLASILLLVVVLVVGCRRRSRRRMMLHGVLRTESGLSSESGRSDADRSPVPSVISSSSLEEVVVQSCSRVRGREHYGEDMPASARLLSWSAEAPSGEMSQSPSFTVTGFRPSLRRAQSAQRAPLRRRSELGSEQSLSSNRSLSEECLSTKHNTLNKDSAAAATNDGTNKHKRSRSVKSALVRPATYPPSGINASGRRSVASADAQRSASPQRTRGEHRRSRHAEASTSHRRDRTAACSYTNNQAFRNNSVSSSSTNNSSPATVRSSRTSSQALPSPPRGTFV